MIKNFCALIPSYNAAKTIGRIIKRVKDRGLVIYVVDDGSADDTATIAEAEGAIVVKHKVNRGKGASLREGFKHILKKNFDAVLIMDADNQHDAEDIDHFLKKMDSTGADIIIGNRMLDTSSMPYIRVVVNRFMSYVISKITGQSIPDSQCGFRLIKKEVLQRIVLESSRYEIDSEIIIKAARDNFKIESVPVKTLYQGEASRINPFLDTLRFIALLIKIGFKK